MATKKFLFDWTGFYAKHLVSAAVEDAAKSDVVMTFSPAASVKAFARSVDTEFTLSGKTVDLLTLDYAAGTVDVHVTAAYSAGAGFNLTHNPAGKGDTVVTAVINRVA
jgi:fructose-specific component phosphotransferase system IIB-like protein